MTLQAFRYPRRSWSASEARAHCRNHEGELFEPATAEDVVVDFSEIAGKVREQEIAELELYAKGGVPAPTLYRAVPDAVRAKPKEDGPIEFVANEESEDRAGDVVLASAWDLSAFKRNPVMQWAHGYNVPPIGRWQDVRVEGKQLLGSAEFDRSDPFAVQVEQKYRSGFLNAVSVGFRVFEFERRDEEEKRAKGFVFKRVELLEISAVPVPMHPRALRKGLSLMEPGRKYLFMPGEAPGQFVAHEIPEVGSEDRAATAPHSTPKADEDADWDAGAEVRRAEGAAQLRRMHAWVDPDGDPDAKSSYKLPHHRADGTVVWRGVAAAMAALMGSRGGVDIPAADERGVHRHLAGHYRQFDKEPPELRSAEPNITYSTSNSQTTATFTVKGGGEKSHDDASSGEGAKQKGADLSAVVEALRRVREE